MQGTKRHAPWMDLLFLVVFISFFSPPHTLAISSSSSSSSSLSFSSTFNVTNDMGLREDSFSFRLYSWERNGFTAPPINLSTPLPQEIQDLLLISFVRWEDLSGILQRLVLWDAGYVLDEALEPVQIYTRCGISSMDDIVLNRTSYFATGCSALGCGSRLHAGQCPEAMITQVSHCAVRPRLNMTIRSNHTFWSEEDDLAKTKPLSPLLTRASNGLYAIEMQPALQHQVLSSACPRISSTVIPCATVTETDIDTDTWCPVQSTGLLRQLLLESGPPHARDTSIVAWISVAILAFLCILLVALLHRQREMRSRFDFHALHQYNKRSSLASISSRSRSLSRLPVPPSIPPLSHRERHNHVVSLYERPQSYSDVITSSEIMLKFENDPLVRSKRIPMVDVTYASIMCQGASGEVFLGQVEDQYVALKQLVATKKNDPSHIEQFALEIQLHASLSHPNIVAFVGVAWNSFQNMVLVLEYKPCGDLLYALKAYGKQYSWGNEKSRIAVGIAQAIAYLHSLTTPVVHRDIKSRNILMDEHGNPALCDFGMSCDVCSLELMSNDMAGTILWNAPEMIQGKDYDEKSDIYSFGVVLSEIDTCSIPYSDQQDPEGGKLQTLRVAHLVAADQIKPTLTNQCPEYIRRVAQECLHHDPTKRPTAYEVVYLLSHPVFREDESFSSYDLPRMVEL